MSSSRRGLWWRLAELACLLFAIVIWQHTFLAPGVTVDPSYKVTASTGINMEKRFFFYLYHLDLFPIATDAPITADTAEEARRLLTAAPRALRQDQGSTFRSGDRGRTYLYFIDAWSRHDSLDPSLRPAHWLAFTLALCALQISFWSLGRSLSGFLLVFLLGSNPFQLYVVYGQENVFSWPITTMIFLLAIHLPLFSKPRRRRSLRYYPWIAALSTGLLMAAVRNIRGEPTALLASVVFVYLTMTWLRKRARAALIALMAGTMWLGGLASTKFMDHKLEESKRVVESVGGPAYHGPLIMYHEFWHAVFCGLGDYDTKHGYVWDDFVAIAYVQPRLQALHPEIVVENANIQSRFYDDAQRHPVFIGEIPGYHEIAREKVLGDIEHDPLWYADILAHRAFFILSDTTPVGFASTHGSFYFMAGRFVGWLWGFIMILALLRRRWFTVKLVLFSMPLCATAFLIYSGGGTSYYGTYHIFAVFAGVMMVVDRIARRPKVTLF